MYFEVVGTNIRLLGTAHRFPVGMPSIPAWVRSAFDWSEAIVPEQKCDPAFSCFRLPSGQRLSGKLSSGTWNKLRRRWPANPNVPLDALHPWGALVLAPTTVLQSEPGVEAALAEWCEEDGKPLTYLETPSEFAAILGSVPFPDV